MTGLMQATFAYHKKVLKIMRPQMIKDTMRMTGLSDLLAKRVSKTKRKVAF